MLTAVISKQKPSIVLPNELEASPLIFGFSLSVRHISEKNKKGKGFGIQMKPRLRVGAISEWYMDVV